MTLKQLEYFMAVAKALNYSEAAKQLFISQPALSRSIAALEEELGVILFFRTRHSVALTPAGMTLAAHMPRLKNELEKMVRLVQQADEGVRGKLSFTALNGTPIPDVLSSAFEYFRESLPYIELELRSADCPDIRRELDEGTADVVFAHFTEEELQDTGPYSSLLLSSSRACLAMTASNHPGAECISISELKNDSFIFPYGSSSPRFVAWQNLCADHDFTPHTQFTDNIASQMLWIEQGYGLGVFPDKHRIFASPGIRRVELQEPHFLKCCILWNTMNLNPSVDLFTKLIRGDI